LYRLFFFTIFVVCLTKPLNTMTKKIYPYEEGDDYWIVLKTDEGYDDNTGYYYNGIIAIQSCWDDVSEELHRENPNKQYFNSLHEVLQYAKYEYQFIKIECFNSGIDDIENGDYFVTTDTNCCDKFQKSY
jgi:hypothetical protein